MFAKTWWQDSVKCNPLVHRRDDGKAWLGLFKIRRENHIVKLVKKCLDGKALSYFSNYFQLRTYDIHDYDTRNNNKLVIDRIKLESTKRAFL